MEDEVVPGRKVIYTQTADFAKCFTPLYSIVTAVMISTQHHISDILQVHTSVDFSGAVVILLQADVNGLPSLLTILQRVSLNWVDMAQ